MEITDIARHLILIFGSGLFAFIISILAAKPFIYLLKKYKIGKKLRDTTTDGKKAELYQKLHADKAGVPTMGGILIWVTVLVVVLISILMEVTGVFDRSLLSRQETYLPIATLVIVAILGIADDWLNIKGKGATKGLSFKMKTFLLTLFALGGGLWFYIKLGYDTINIPLVGNAEIGIWYIPIFILIILASAHSVNVADGLDGLAGGLLIITFASLGILAYLHSLVILAGLCAVICGATMGFLWFNIPPAKFIMGDTGAFSLGATMGVIALMTDTMLLLPLIGFMFVIEGGSTIIQLLSKKFRKKKIFHIAPLHHHLEYIGWPEFQVTMRFWTLGSIFALGGIIIALLNNGF